METTLNTFRISEFSLIKCSTQEGFWLTITLTMVTLVEHPVPSDWVSDKYFRDQTRTMSAKDPSPFYSSKTEFGRPPEGYKVDVKPYDWNYCLAIVFIQIQGSSGDFFIK